jgi:hypothetical protein
MGSAGHGDGDRAGHHESAYLGAMKHDGLLALKVSGPGGQ